MVAAATQQQQQHQPQEQDQLKHQQPAPTAEDEALKRNTDCVYFLASPLTCKKGSECEYRHSEYARVNPRDCYYWLNSNCLNPKCGFRHPPLDGLLGTQVVAPAGASVVSSQTAVPAVAQVPYSSSAPYGATAPYNSIAPSNSSKPVVPCIFFQKGYCIKGDRCAFLHGPVPTINKAQQVTVANLATGPPSLKKTFGALEKCTQQQKIPPANITKTVEVPHEPKAGPKVDTVPPRNNLGNKRHAAPPAGLNEEVSRYKASNITPVVNGSSMVHANLSHQAYMSDEQSYHTGKDIDEHLRESSPGFNVLVDDELGESEYYRGENQYGRAKGHEGRNGNEYDLSRSANYDADADGDREMFRDTRGYDSYDRVQGQYDRNHRRASSERISLGSGHLERRGYSKAESPDRIGESDLRYRLTKHRRVNGLRSVITHDHVPENHVEERSYRGSSRRDSHHESSLSSRLRGRIKLPGRSPVNDTESLSEREMERGRSWGRLSPGRPQISHSGRLHERIKGRVEEEFNSKDDRSIRGVPRMRRDIMDDLRPNFAAPKRLAELKVVKDVGNKEQHVLRKRKALEDQQQSEGDLSFEGPMPLSEIMKRKKQAKTEASENGFPSLNKEDRDQKITKESLSGNSTNAVAQSISSSASKEETISKEESKPVNAEDVGTEGKTEVAHGESSQLPVASDHEVEDGMIVDEGIEDDELLGDEQREDGEEYYYEQVDEGDYGYEDAENLEPEEEYLDDDDGDDFAKKIGVVLS